MRLFFDVVKDEVMWMLLTLVIKLFKLFMWFDSRLFMFLRPFGQPKTFL